MSDYHEFEYFMEEFMEFGLAPILLSNSWSFLLSIAAYVLTSLALYTLARRRCIKNAWLSWIPVVNCWIIGSLSDQFRYVTKGEVKNKRKTLLILNIVTWIFSLAMIVVLIVMFVNLANGVIIGTDEEELLQSVLGPLMGIFGLCIPMIGVVIATAVVRYMAMYDIYTSCTPKNNVVFLVLSIIFSITEPFFLFFTRDKDEGMPPRRQQPVYEEPQQPVYEEPQEPWDGGETF